MEFSVLNIILLIFFGAAVFHGYKKGLIASLIHWIGLIASSILVLRYAPMVKVGIMNKFPIGAFFATSLSYILIFILIAILANILIIILNQITNLLSMNFLNRIFGAAFGFLNALIVLILFLALIEFLPFTKPIQNWMNKSVIIQETHKIKSTIKPGIYKNKQLNKKVNKKA